MSKRDSRLKSVDWIKKIIIRQGRAALFFRRSLFCIFFLSFVTSCADLAGPKYKQPQTPVKQAWSQQPETQVSADEAIRSDWWTGFGDPYLNELVKQSITGNQNLRIFAARIEDAGANIKVDRASLFPTIGADATATFSRTVGSENFEGDSIQKSYTAKVADLNWELDIWGKTRKGVNSSKAGYKASEWDWRATYLTLVSDVASRYFLIRQLDEQIEKQGETQDRNLLLLGIYEAQVGEGLLPEAQLLSQKAEIASLRQQLEDLRRQRQVAELSLATLLGIPAGELTVPKANLTNVVKLMDVPAGLPSELLKRRPDIIAQEYRVLAAHELVGQAKLEKLPTISLTGAVEGSGPSAALSELIKTWTFGLGPSIRIPIFDKGIEARIKKRKASTKVAEETYKDTVMRAFEEVEILLTNLNSRIKQKALLENQIKHLSIVKQTRYAQLEEGLVSQLQVFETDRTLLAAELAKLQTHQQILSDTVTLYKALGGGWLSEDVQPTDL
ncbi:MAG: efflux transporter outer membrane subunit [Pseudomonadota bacterium]